MSGSCNREPADPACFGVRARRPPDRHIQPINIDASMDKRKVYSSSINDARRGSHPTILIIYSTVAPSAYLLRGNIPVDDYDQADNPSKCGGTRYSAGGKE